MSPIHASIHGASGERAVHQKRKSFTESISVVIGFGVRIESGRIQGLENVVDGLDEELSGHEESTTDVMNLKSNTALSKKWKGKV